MIDLKRIEQILTELCAPDSKAQMGSLFDSYRSDNLAAFSQGMNTFNYFFTGEDTKLASACILSFVAGVFMSGMSEKEEYRKMLFDDVLERAAKSRGDNVADIAAFKASKK